LVENIRFSHLKPSQGGSPVTWGMKAGKKKTRVAGRWATGRWKPCDPMNICLHKGTSLWRTDGAVRSVAEPPSK